MDKKGNNWLPEGKMSGNCEVKVVSGARISSGPLSQ